MTMRRDRLDAAFHLLDRQIIDAEDRLVAKVDDLELVERADGTLAVTAILVGPGALGPRLGGRLGSWTAAIWRRLHPDAEPVPGRIPIGLLTRIDSAVHLGANRHELWLEGFEAWADAHVISQLPLLRQDAAGTGWGPPRAPDPGPPGARRVCELIGQQVRSRNGTRLGHVSDLRLAPDDGQGLPVDGLVVNAGPVGSLLGPERRADQGPWLLRVVVRRLRPPTAGYVPWDGIGDIDWDTRVVRSGGETLADFVP